MNIYQFDVNRGPKSDGSRNDNNHESQLGFIIAPSSNDAVAILKKTVLRDDRYDYKGAVEFLMECSNRDHSRDNSVIATKWFPNDAIISDVISSFGSGMDELNTPSEKDPSNDEIVNNSKPDTDDTAEDTDDTDTDNNTDGSESIFNKISQLCTDFLNEHECIDCRFDTQCDPCVISNKIRDIIRIINYGDRCLEYEDDTEDDTEDDEDND